jgi:hypothetical protein
VKGTVFGAVSFQQLDLSQARARHRLGDEGEANWAMCHASDPTSINVARSFIQQRAHALTDGDVGKCYSELCMLDSDIYALFTKQQYSGFACCVGYPSKKLVKVVFRFPHQTSPKKLFYMRDSII